MTEKIKLLDVKESPNYVMGGLYLVSLKYPDGEELTDVEFSSTDIIYNLFYNKDWDDTNGAWKRMIRS